MSPAISALLLVIFSSTAYAQTSTANTMSDNQSMSGGQCMVCDNGVRVYGEHYINSAWQRDTREHAGKVEICVLPAYQYDGRTFVNFAVNGNVVNYGVRQQDWKATCVE